MKTLVMLQNHQISTKRAILTWVCQTNAKLQHIVRQLTAMPEGYLIGMRPSTRHGARTMAETKANVMWKRAMKAKVPSGCLQLGDLRLRVCAFVSPILLVEYSFFAAAASMDSGGRVLRLRSGLREAGLLGLGV